MAALPAAPLALVDPASGQLASHHALLKPLAEAFVGKHMEPFMIQVSRIPDEEVRFISHHREEFLFVTRGTLECLLQTPDGPARETLSPGDRTTSRLHLPHCLRAATDEGASAIDIVHAPYGTAESEHGDMAIYFSNGMAKSLTEQIAAQIAALRQSRGMAMNDFACELELEPAPAGRRRTGPQVAVHRPAAPRLPPLPQAARDFLARTVVSRPFYEVQRAADIARLPVRGRKRLVDGS